MDTSLERSFSACLKQSAVESASGRPRFSTTRVWANEMDEDQTSCSKLVSGTGMYSNGERSA